jgi:hypothetical protein
MNRKDFYIGSLHIIKRNYEDPQYGILLWRKPRSHIPTFDIWFNKTLWTVRKLGRYR